MGHGDIQVPVQPSDDFVFLPLLTTIFLFFLTEFLVLNYFFYGALN